MNVGIRYESIFPNPEGAAKGAKYVIETEDNTLWTATIGRSFGGGTKRARRKQGGNRVKTLLPLILSVLFTVAPTVLAIDTIKPAEAPQHAGEEVHY
jgi:hypothetical protein